MLASLLFKTTPRAVKPSDVIRVLREAVLEVRALCGEEVPGVDNPSVESVRHKAETADRNLERSIQAVLETLEE